MNRIKFSSKFKLLFQVFFSFQEFLQQHENTVKSNNQKNNCINQLLRLLLLKYTQKTDKNNNKKMQYQPLSPRKKHSTTPLTEVLMATVKE